MEFGRKTDKLIEEQKYSAAWKVSKYGVLSGLHFPTGKYGPEKTAYLDIFHVIFEFNSINFRL